MMNEQQIFSQIQEQVCNILNAEEYLSCYQFLASNRLDIDYEIQKSLQETGAACVVQVDSATYQGVTDAGLIAWTIEELVLQCAENTAVNREMDDAHTALDVINYAVERLCSGSSEYFGQFCPVNIEQDEDNGLLVVKGTLKCTLFTDGQYVDWQEGQKIVKYWAEKDWVLSNFAQLSDLTNLSTYTTSAQVSNIVEGYGYATQANLNLSIQNVNNNIYNLSSELSNAGAKIYYHIWED